MVEEMEGVVSQERYDRPVCGRGQVKKIAEKFRRSVVVSDYWKKDELYDVQQDVWWKESPC